jgi:hypothetical protein
LAMRAMVYLSCCYRICDLIVTASKIDDALGVMLLSEMQAESISGMRAELIANLLAILQVTLAGFWSRDGRKRPPE